MKRGMLAELILLAIDLVVAKGLVFGTISLLKLQAGLESSLIRLWRRKFNRVAADILEQIKALLKS